MFSENQHTLKSLSAPLQIWFFHLPCCWLDTFCLQVVAFLNAILWHLEIILLERAFYQETCQCLFWPLPADSQTLWNCLFCLDPSIHFGFILFFPAKITTENKTSDHLQLPSETMLCIHGSEKLMIVLSNESYVNCDLELIICFNFPAAVLPSWCLHEIWLPLPISKMTWVSLAGKVGQLIGKVSSCRTPMEGFVSSYLPSFLQKHLYFLNTSVIFFCRETTSFWCTSHILLYCFPPHKGFHCILFCGLLLMYTY